jgi:protein-S-isoprenylcysteine O-methyltransferase Ste14
MILDLIGIIGLTILSGIRLGQLLEGDWMVFPLFFHAFLSAVFLVLNIKDNKRAPLIRRLVAWCSAALPMLIKLDLVVPFSIKLLSMLGVIIAIWALLSLGKSFDVSPADRGLVNKGPYQYVRHPMYASQLLSVIVLVLINPSFRNLSVLLGLFISTFLRIRWEEDLIIGYGDYSNRVIFRLIPGVW